MNKVTAKFEVTNNTTVEDPKGNKISLSAVVNGSPENEEFFKLTPERK